MIYNHKRKFLRLRKKLVSLIFFWKITFSSRWNRVNKIKIKLYSKIESRQTLVVWEKTRRPPPPKTRRRPWPSLRRTPYGVYGTRLRRWLGQLRRWTSIRFTGLFSFAWLSPLLESPFPHRTSLTSSSPTSSGKITLLSPGSFSRKL